MDLTAEVKKLLKRADKCVSTYTPGEAKMRVDADLIRKICSAFISDEINKNLDTFFNPGE